MFKTSKFQSTKLVIAALIPLSLVLSSCTSPEERAQSYYEDGMKRLADHDTGRAGIEFRNAVKYNKRLLPAWKELAQIEEQNKNWGALIPILRALVELEPDDAQAKLRLARLLSLSGAIDEALGLVNSVTAKDPNNEEALALNGVLLYKLKDYDGAVKGAKSALAINPSNSEAILVLAAERLEQGDAKAALNVLNSHMSGANADDISLLLFKLKTVEQMRDLPEAEKLLTRLIELHPDQPGFHKQLVQVYLAEKKTGDGVKEARALSEAHPDDVKLGLEFIQLLYATSGPAAARQELVTRINAGKDTFQYQTALAKLDNAQGNFADASKLLQSLISGASSKDNVLAAEGLLAEMDLARKDTSAAETLVADMLHKDSHNILGLRLRAGINLDRGKPELAVDDLRQALNDQPNSAELMSLLALAYDRSGLIELAEKQFADATTASKFDPQIGLAYVAFLQRRGNLARAEDIVTDLSSRWPTNTQILKVLGDIRLSRQNWVGAQEVADKIRHIGKDEAGADRLLGASLMGRNKFDDSLSALEQAYSAAPANGQSLGALIQAYVRAKKTDRALAFLQTLLKANPSNAEALVYLGSLQRINNAPDEAQKSFTAAIAKQPNDPIGYRALSDFYLSQKKYAEALATVQAGLDKQPDNTTLLLISAGILESQGDYAGAIAKYEHILQKEPGSLIAANNLASLLADHPTNKSDLEHAASLAAMLRQSPIPQFKDTLGWVTFQKGDVQNAIPLLEAAAAALPAQALVHYHLGQSYVAAGETKKAAEQLNLAMTGTTDEALKQKIRAALDKLAT